MDFLFGLDNKSRIREYERIISEINKYGKAIKNLSSEELKGKTNEFRERISKGETLDDILPEAFAVVREASKRFIGIEQYPVQIMGAIALHRGDVAQMKTGEGKTYTAPLAAYLNALIDKPVHIATANDVLALRDGDLVKPLFEGLGLTVGVVTEKREDNFKEDIDKRKKAYSCDITYGSSNAFAFDYLRDNTTYNLGTVVRSREPGFIIIDEADQILVNDAVMPFILSGSIKSVNENVIETIQRRREEQKLLDERNKSIIDANGFVYKLFRDEDRAKGFKTEEQMALYMGGNSEATSKANREYCVLYSPSNSAVLTERGWLEAFRYFNQTKINKILEKEKNVILANPEFIEGKDYTIDNDNLELTLTGLSKAIKEVDSFNRLNNSFYNSEEFENLKKAIDNSLKAYFVLENGKEYILADARDNKTGIIKKKVLLVSNGRTADGRVYSDGLQQAIEVKEKRLNPSISTNISITDEHDELASISQKAFYSIYPKISGMTGTSSEALFEEIYGMDTVKIPKNSEYQASDEEINSIYSGRFDKDTVIFETDKEKIDAVVESVLESIKKGQPVLIGTTSVNESKKLYDEFKKKGISCEVLNAEVENIEKENEIISRAGVRCSVTISTQMAGRGTDIKLGGTLDDFILKVKEEKVELMVKNILLQKNEVDEQTRRQYKISALDYLERVKKDEIIKEASERLEKEKEQLVRVGGLKVIGFGHFKTKRDDDQLRGRAARQADPGVTEFYCSVRDLKEELAISNDRIRYLRKKGLGKNAPLSGRAVDDVISSAQSNIEWAITSYIASTQDADYHLSKMRKKIYDQRMRMLKGESPKENIEYIIETSVFNIIDRNLPEHVKEVSARKTVNSSKLNINNFVIDVEETFGIDLTEKFENGEFKNLGDIQKFVTRQAHDRYHNIRNKNGEEAQDKIDRDSIIGVLDSAWLDFNNNLDYIKRQNILHSMVQNKDYDEIFAMKQGFNQSMIDAKISMVSRMIGKKSSKKRTATVEEEMLELDTSINGYDVEENVETKNSAINLDVRPPKLVTVFTEKLRLVKDKTKQFFGRIGTADHNRYDKVDQINFDETINEVSRLMAERGEHSTKGK